MHRMVVYMMRVPTHSTTLIEETKKVKKVLMMTRMNYRCCSGLFLYLGSLAKIIQMAPIRCQVTSNNSADVQLQHQAGDTATLAHT